MKTTTNYLIFRRAGGARSLGFRLGATSIVLAKAARAGLVAGIVVLALLGALTFADNARLERAKAENAALKERLVDGHERLAALDPVLREMGRGTVLANRRFGMDLPDPAQLAFSVGGAVNPDTALMQSIPSVRLANRIAARGTAVNRFVEENRRQLDDIEEVAKRKLLAWRYHPSVKPCQGRVTSEFGFRIHPVTGTFKMHSGLDIADAPWTPVLATADGVVSEVSNRPESFYGQLVRIDHENGYQTLYAHLAAPAVKPGQFIQRHQLVGYMGSTGRVTGTHLHYEVRRNGDPVNPRRFILPPSVMVD